MAKKEMDFEEEEQEEEDSQVAEQGDYTRWGIALLVAAIVSWLSFYIIGFWGAFLVFLLIAGFMISAFTGTGGGLALPVIAMVIGGIFGFWLAGPIGLTLEIPIIVWFGLGHSLGGEEGELGAEDQFLRLMGVILSFIPFIILFVWPIIGGFFGSQVAMVQSGLGDFFGLINRQKDLLTSADYRNYLGMQDSVYDTSSQEAETFSNPTSAFGIESFTISPDSGCFGRATFSLFGVVENTGDSILDTVYVGFKLDPEQIDTGCGTAIGDLGYINQCEEQGGDCLFNSYCIEGETRDELRRMEVKCDENQRQRGCYCIDSDEINTLYPGEVSQFVKIIEPEDIGVETISCRLFAYARTSYHVKSRLEVTAMDTNYSLLKGVSFSSVPAVQSIGPVKLKMDIGSQPILNTEDQRVLQVSLGNEGDGELTNLRQIVLFVPKEFSIQGCQGGQFIATDCEQLKNDEQKHLINKCEELGKDYNIFKVDINLLEHSSYACVMDINQGQDGIELGGGNRRSFIFRADAFYDYEVDSSAILQGGSC